MGTVQYKVISQAVILTGDSVSSIININTLFGLVIALAVIVEDGGQGGGLAANIAGQLIKLNLKK